MKAPRQDLSTSPRIIGITGGIGMGKTTVSNHLAQVYQVPVYDADIYAREAVELGNPILNEIADRYGSGVLHPDGSLNRHRLGDIIFNCLAERLWLEQRIHPYVRDRLLTAIRHTPIDLGHQSVIVLVVPLLFEARMTDLVTDIWVIYCSAEQQLQRLQQRDHLTPEQANARVSSQMAVEKKIACADVVLDNSGDVQHLLQQVDQAMHRIQQSQRIPPPCLSSHSVHNGKVLRHLS